MRFKWPELKLKTRFANLAAKARKFSLKINVKLVFFLVFVFIVTLSIGLFISSIFTASPGDFSFTLKALYESSKLKSINSDEERLKYINGILADRYKSYKFLIQNNNCVQIILIEDDILNNIEKSLNIVSTLADNEKKLFYIKGMDFDYNQYELDKLSTTCILKEDLKQLDFVFTAVASKLNPEDLDSNETSVISTVMTENYNKYAEKIHSLKFSSQDDLNKVVDISLTIKQNNEYINTGKDIVLKRIKVKVNESLFVTLDKIFEDVKATVIHPDVSARFICNFSKNEICSPEKFTARWNSVRGESNIKKQIELGEQVFIEYFNVFIDEFFNR